MKNVSIPIIIDSLTLKEFEQWYDERMCDFKDFSEFLVTMAYHGMKDDQKRAKKGETRMKRFCGWCGELKEVYGYKEVDFEEVKNLNKDALLIEDNGKPLRDDDVVGIPICKECYEEGG